MSLDSIRTVFPLGVNHYWPTQGPYTSAWLGSDNERNYNKIRSAFVSKLPHIKWRWLDETIEYHVNSNGLRNTFNMDADYDFSDKYVVLGCSHVEGTGNLAHQTIPGFIESKTGVKTINMGNGGSGCDIVFYNAIWLSTVKNPPKKIFILWPDTSRFSNFILEYDEEALVKSSKGSSVIMDSFLSQHCDTRKMFRENYRLNIMANPVIQSSNKLLWQKLLKNTWGDRMVELDIIDKSSFNQTYQGDGPRREILNGMEKDKCDDPEEYLNDWCARDIYFQNIRKVLNKKTRYELHHHFGWRINDSISEWFISQ